MGLIEEQFENLKARERYAEAQLQKMPNGVLVTIPRFGLPTGWNKPETTVYFMLPIGYPVAKPDTFWTDPELRLASGAMPQSVGKNDGHGLGKDLLWFSWHPGTWNPNRDSILSYVGVIIKRLQELR